MASESRPQLPTATATIRQNDLNGETKTPPSPTSALSTTNAAARRHAKGLSLNLPILLPPTPQMSQAQSPTANSSYQSPLDSARSSPRARASPFRHSDPVTETGEPSKSRTSSDFFTLLAAQERKVLELREELHKAEADLLGLKKQWASYEANKKREEVKHVKKLQPLPLDDVTATGRELVFAEDEADEERRKKIAMVGRANTFNSPAVNNNGSGASSLARKGSKRVFEGGRHTRALSLLSPTSSKPGRAATAKSRDERIGQVDALPETEPGNVLTQPSFPGMPALDGLISGDPLQLGFGKTYKELAAHRRSLPPVAADLLVKQGKQVYDGMREGLWTFWEDIRQATVGEEGINGTAQQQRPTKPTTQKKTARKASNGAGLGLQKTKTSSSTEDGERGRSSKEGSFWREFGLDTPKRQPATPPVETGQDTARGHVPQKSSTDSTNPPSLLPDLNDNEEEVEDAWDAWDSPVTIRQAAERPWDNKEVSGPETGPDPGPASEHNTVTVSVAVQKAEQADDTLPWPEIQKLTPTKLTRTVSDLMREWDAGSNSNGGGMNVKESTSIPNGLASERSNLTDLADANGQAHHPLDSPHM
ncbi:hypothetical protein A1O3_00486 [Capronia epimyces CBS 606.96]|uniref:DUF4048 domain-containing protein n=1 Tax=Capronia epimyces CBS 606.96 TaxID=1182542 RepID=W9YRR8_9EURO|nr:uncharacterized protein A1O3_00486 [Capronia epimyces CBS 606.96]EXJ91936.1 hypothetical protein A1O3_00486 [Capronia epimyces CBS 606.96]